jgi:acyl-CoA thioesterase
MHHPFAELIDLNVTEVRAGLSKCALTVADKHLNPHRVVHGAVLYALADTGMGAALYPSLGEGEICATIQITMNYFKPVHAGLIVCTTEVINRGKSVAHIESRLFVGDALVATANGNYSIFKPIRTAQ